jgi:quinol monooxygenase YgiN
MKMRTVVSLVLTLMFMKVSLAQDSQQMTRLAKVKVDPTQLQQYNAALKTQMETAIKTEKGVLSYYAVADKKDPTKITILEIYANHAAYEAHIKTPHFLKYKDMVKNMVQSLELEDVDLIAFAKKPGM